MTATTTTNNNNNTAVDNGERPSSEAADDEENEDGLVGVLGKKLWKVWLFSGVLVLDFWTIVFLLPFFQPSLLRRAMDNDNIAFYGSLIDFDLLSILRLMAVGGGLWFAYHRPESVEEISPFATHKLNGDKKSQEELDEEALEEAFYPWFVRKASRPSFAGEVMGGVVTQLACVIKCLVRMEVELDHFKGQHPIHPLFWIVILMTSILAMVEAVFLSDMCRRMGQYAKAAQRVQTQEEEEEREQPSGNDLRTPLLGTIEEASTDPTTATNSDMEADEDNSNSINVDPSATTTPTTESEEDKAEEEDVRGVSDIQADTTYKVTKSDLLWSCAPDLPIIVLGFVFLILAATAEVCIPRFLGNIMDTLTETFAGDDDDDSNHDIPMWDVPGFVSNIQWLLAAAIAAGVFAGIRAALFTIAGGRVNIRLRIQLMDSLLAQDVSFFDMTKTGDITSRLSSDTTLVGNQAIRSVDVLFKCLVHSLGVLVFMILASWQLTLLTLISFPMTAIISKWFGDYMRLLTKLQQKKLADGNSVSEAAISSMSTVRSFDAAESELQEFEKCMEKYLYFQHKGAVAFGTFITLLEAVPQLVYAIVVFYGGLQIRNGDLTVGGLVSFLLYLQSLSDEFAAIGYVFGNLTQAVGAADKIFELMNREPKYTKPSSSSESDSRSGAAGPPPPPNNAQQEDLTAGVLGVKATKTRGQRTAGLWPQEPARGEIVLDKVEMQYPSRPMKSVLDGISLTVPAGSTVAFVGKSGSGKSSIMGLIQHLYEPTSGKILFDGNDILELSPQFLSRNVSIVSQEPTLFGRSVKKNIIYGLEGTDAEPSDEDIVQAAKLANADSFVQKMPQKYDTEVGERGVQLSGGQKQRIAIARALVRHPRVLLLDEATSALDAESEHLVQQAIDDMLARSKTSDGGTSMTVLIVAHRLSTVRNADRIFVIDEGKVVEEGHHNELVQNPDGAYSALIQRQLQAQQKLEERNDRGAEPAESPTE